MTDNWEFRDDITQEEFQQLAAAFLQERVMPLLERKGAHYSNKSAFTNFDEGSRLHGLSPARYLMVLATKHWQSLCQNPERNVTERAIDIIVYMLLLVMMERRVRANETHEDLVIRDLSGKFKPYKEHTE